MRHKQSYLLSDYLISRVGLFESDQYSYTPDYKFTSFRLIRDREESKSKYSAMEMTFSFIDFSKKMVFFL